MTINSTAVIKKLLIFFLVIAGLIYARNFFIPILIGVVVATLFLPVSRKLEARGFSRGLAAFVCLVLLILFTLGIGSLIAWQVSGIVNDLPFIRRQAAELIIQARQFIYSSFGVSFDPSTGIFRQEQSLVNGMARMAGSLFMFLATSFLVVVYVFLLLYYRNHLRRFLLKVTPQNQQAEMDQVIQSVADVSHRYLVGLAKMIVLLWIMYGIGFSALGVKNALFFAILCGLLEIVPYIGNITGTLITLLVAASQGASPAMLVGIAATYGAVQFIQGWFLEPLIVGPHVRINPLFTIIALVIGQLVWGIPGIFLAIPLIAVFKIVSDHVESLKPYSFLVGETVARQHRPGVWRKIRTWFTSKK